MITLPALASPFLTPQLQDLIKDSRLAKVGGKQVFDFLAQQLIDYGTTKGLVRSVVAGSSAELLNKLGETSVASGERVKRYALLDPPEDEVRKALVGVGYSAEDAARIVLSCGARLRPLEEPLRDRKLVPADELILERERTAKSQFGNLFHSLSELNDGGSAFADVITLLDCVEAAELAEAAGGGSAYPCWNEVPAAAIAADISRVSFLDLDDRLHFQSRVHRRIWGSYRASAEVQLLKGRERRSR